MLSKDILDVYDLIHNFDLNNSKSNHLETKLDDFLKTYQLRLVDVPDDGHCFLSVIRLFFQQYLPLAPQLTVQEIRDKYYSLFDKSIFQHLESIGNHSATTYRHQADAFFDDARPASDFFDYFVTQCTLVFSIRFSIIQQMTYDKRTTLQFINYGTSDITIQYPNHHILIAKIGNHHKLIIPANNTIHYKIQDFVQGGHIKPFIEPNPLVTINPQSQPSIRQQPTIQPEHDYDADDEQIDDDQSRPAKRGKTTKIPWPEIDPTPINEFRTPFLASMAFPMLFPYCHGDPFGNYPNGDQKTRLEKIRHLLFYTEPALHDPKSPLKNVHYWNRFAAHPYFVLWIGNVTARHNMLNQGDIYIQHFPGDANQTAQQLRDIVNDKDHIGLLNHILQYTSRIMATPCYWYNESQKLNAIIETMGPPDFFFTNSCANRYSFLLFFHLIKQKT